MLYDNNVGDTVTDVFNIGGFSTGGFSLHNYIPERTLRTALMGKYAATCLSGPPVFWPLVLMLAACGGGGGGGGAPTTSGAKVASPAESTSAKSGFIYDGPIEGANVYVDVDGDSELNKKIDVFVGRSNKQGQFKGNVPTQHTDKRYIVDLTGAVDHGEDPDSDLDNQDMEGIWLAPVGSTMVSAITHLIATGFTTVGQVQDAIPNFNPLTDNPYSTPVTPAKKVAFDKAKAILPALTKVVQDNRKDIDQNARDIAANRTSIDTLKDRLKELELKLQKVIKSELVLVNDAFVQNAKPAKVSLVQLSPAINVGDNVATIGALARIIITDDGQGKFSLTPLPANSIFEYRPTSQPHVFELYLKPGTVLDQSKVGSHKINIAVTGDGTGNNPASVPFTLTVRNIEHDPVMTKSGSLASLDETTNSIAANMGLRFTVTDADGNFTGAPTVNDNRFELKPSGQGWQLWVKANQTFASGERISLTISAVDAANRTDTEIIDFTIGDIEHDPTLTTELPAQSPQINETVGNGVTQGTIDTGIAVSARDDDGTTPSLTIHRKNADNTFVLDDRFAVQNGKLVILAGKTLNYEDANNPNGLIILRITVTDATDHSRSVTKEVSFIITNSDERPTAMTLTPTASNTSFVETTNIPAGGLELATVAFTGDPDPVGLRGQSNSVILTVSGNGHNLSASNFEFLGGKIYLKSSADISVTADARVTVTVTPSTSASDNIVAELPSQDFTFTITDVPPAPVIPATVHFVQEGRQIGQIYESVAQVLTQGNVIITNKNNAGDTLPGASQQVTITNMRVNDRGNVVVTFAINGQEGESQATLRLIGDDADKFRLALVNNELQLLFKDPSDFENPTDLNGNNLYSLTLENTDLAGRNGATAGVIVSVQDNEQENDETIPHLQATHYVFDDTGIYNVPVEQTFVTFFTPQSIVDIFNITEPKDVDSYRFMLISDTRILLEFVNSQDAVIGQYIIYLDAWGETRRRSLDFNDLFHFVPMGKNGERPDGTNALHAINLEFRAAPDNEQPNTFGIENLGYASTTLNIRPVGLSTEISQNPREIRVFIINDDSDDATLGHQTKTLKLVPDQRSLLFVSNPLSFEEDAYDSATITQFTPNGRHSATVTVKFTTGNTEINKIYSIKIEGYHTDTSHFAIKFRTGGIHVVNESTDIRNGGYPFTYQVKDTATDTTVVTQKYTVHVTVPDHNGSNTFHDGRDEWRNYLSGDFYINTFVIDGIPSAGSSADVIQNFEYGKDKIKIDSDITTVWWKRYDDDDNDDSTNNMRLYSEKDNSSSLLAFLNGRGIAFLDASDFVDPITVNEIM